MNEKIKKLHSKFDALQSREKIMVASLFFVLLIVAWQTILFDEAVTKKTKLTNQIKTQQQTNTTIKVETAAYKDRVNNNPNVKLKKERTQYLNKIEILDEQLNKKMKGLISPRKMTSMLKDIFKSNKSLTLLSLENLKTQTMFDFTGDEEIQNSAGISVTDKINNDDDADTAVVYRHPVKIVFTGSYLNTMAYLKSIEKMPWDLYWDSVHLDVEKYPKAIIVITVFTLSLKKGWIGV